MSTMEESSDGGGGGSRRALTRGARSTMDGLEAHQQPLRLQQPPEQNIIKSGSSNDGNDNVNGNDSVGIDNDNDKGITAPLMQSLFGSAGKQDDQEVFDEEQLREDSYSFIMTAKYPNFTTFFKLLCLICCCWYLYIFFFCCCCCFFSPFSKKKEEAEDEEDNVNPSVSPALATDGNAPPDTNALPDANATPDANVDPNNEMTMEENNQKTSYEDDKIVDPAGHDEEKAGTTSSQHQDENKNKETKETEETTEHLDYMYLPFWAGFSIFGMQMFIYVVVIANLYSSGDIPPNAGFWLRLAQVFAVFVTLYTQGDFIDGVFLATEGPANFSKVATPKKFWLSVVLRMIAGNVGVVGTFMLIIYSSDVVEMLLNFTAMEFVAFLDDAAFDIASKGFLGSTLAKKATVISEFRYYPSVGRHAGKRMYWYGIYIVLVFIAYGLVWAGQAKRSIGVDNEVYVQFDDSDAPELFGISGVYKGCQGFRDFFYDTGPIIYIPANRECPDKNSYPGNAFYYCWVIADRANYYEATEIPEGWVYARGPIDTKYGPCTTSPRMYILRSSKDDGQSSDSYDLTTHSSADWVVQRSEFGGEVILDSFLIAGVDKYKNVFIECDTGLEFRGPGDVSKSFDILDDKYIPSISDNDTKFGLMLRSVFFRRKQQEEEEEEEDGERFEVVLFDGLRWLYLDVDLDAFQKIISNDDDATCGSDQMDPDCWSNFVTFFQVMDLSKVGALRDNGALIFNAISDPMLLLTGSDTGIPTSSLAWYEVEEFRNSFRPGRALPTDFSSINQNSTTVVVGNDEEYYFQCLRRLPSRCPKGQSGLDVLFTTATFNLETLVLVFAGQNGVEDLSEMNDVNYTEADGGMDVFSTFKNDTVQMISFSKPRTQYTLTSCVQSEQCTQIIVLDTYGDGVEPGAGYDVFYNDTMVSSFYGNFLWSCRSHHVGNNCEISTPPIGNPCNFSEVVLRCPDCYIPCCEGYN